MGGVSKRLLILDKPLVTLNSPYPMAIEEFVAIEEFDVIEFG